MYMSSYICHYLALLLNVSHVFCIKNILVNYILQVCNRSIMLQEIYVSSDSLETEGGVNFVW